VAKRRNLKKEKAERNKAYARQFGKSNNGRFSRGKRFTSQNRNNSSDESSSAAQD
jgi:hypothetical protein